MANSGGAVPEMSGPTYSSKHFDPDYRDPRNRKETPYDCKPGPDKSGPFLGLPGLVYLFCIGALFLKAVIHPMAAKATRRRAPEM